MQAGRQCARVAGASPARCTEKDFARHARTEIRVARLLSDAINHGGLAKPIRPATPQMFSTRP